MKREIGLVLLSLLAGVFLFPEGCSKTEAGSPVAAGTIIALPEPAHDSDTSVEEALLGRRSVRDYSGKAMTLAQLGQLLWAAQGITDPSGKRTAPSAGALYPLEVYAVTGNVEGIEPGVYKYRPKNHELVKTLDGDIRKALSQAALDQEFVAQGAVDIVITAVYKRMTGKYGDRGIMYVHMEAGHAAENICLEVVALKLGTVTVGAFEDDKVKTVLNCPEDEVPLYILPVGDISD
jgi:SagB-type dehydrogenase family enzyme